MYIYMFIYIYIYIYIYILHDKKILSYPSFTKAETAAWHSTQQPVKLTVEGCLNK